IVAAPPPVFVPPPAPAPQPVVRTPAPVMAAPPPREKKPGISLEKWLSENGLAWIGGAAFTFGGAFLVAYAAQRGFFTPIMRLWAALILGFGLIGASEWVRRFALTNKGGHPLVAALLAGAGAAILYTASWGAYGLYGYIGLPAAAVALVFCSGLLLLLSFRHGEALGVLAVVAAFLAPPLTSMGLWPEAAISIYVLVVGFGGYAVAILRRTAWVAGATAFGLYIWFALSMGDGHLPRALALLSFAALGGAAMALRAPNAPNAHWRSAHALMPSITVIVSSIFVLAVWIATAVKAAPDMAGVAAVAIGHVALAAFAVRARLMRSEVLAATIVALVLGFVLFMQRGAPAPNFYAWTLAASAACAALTFVVVIRDRRDWFASSAGAVGSLFLLLVAALTQSWSSPQVYAPFAAGAGVFALAAFALSRGKPGKAEALCVDIWASAGVAALLLAIESAAPNELKPAACALAALLFAALYAQGGWRSMSGAALVAAALSLAHALSPSYAGAGWDGALNIWMVAATLFAAAVALFGASRVIQLRDRMAQSAEALSSAAIITLVLTVFLVLHWFAQGAGPLDLFTEWSLRALTLIVAGFVAFPRKPESVGRIARARGHVLMGLGLAMSVIALGFGANPWWGVNAQPIIGPPLINALALAFAAPAALAILTARKFYGKRINVARFYAVAGSLLAAIYVALEVRHAFHPTQMALADVGVLEGDCYALAFLVAAYACAAWSRYKLQGANAERPFSADLHHSIGVSASAAISIAALLLLVGFNPWWGDFRGVSRSVIENALAVLAHLAAAAIAVAIALALPPRATRSRFGAVIASSAFGLSFGMLAIRFAFHADAMGFGEAARSVEPILHSLWPLAYVMAASHATHLLGVREAGREVVGRFNMIWSWSLAPALFFCVAGLWLFANPWWGVAAAQFDTVLAALVGLALYAASAALALVSIRLPYAKENALYGNVVKVCTTTLLFLTLTLSVRYAFHGGAMSHAVGDESVETWTYSALWALFGAGVLALGALRKDGVLRWSGLAVLLGVTAKVFLFDMSALDGVIRAASFLGLGGVLVVVALATRRIGRGATGAN
ncbi:MAG: DUF2339 domain-containing protein, partial [Pseudomonadota bacterium]